MFYIDVLNNKTDRRFTLTYYEYPKWRRVIGKVRRHKGITYLGEWKD